MSDQMKRLYRSVHKRMVGGVCAGVAEYFGIDVTLVRLAWVVLTIFNGIGLLLYVVCLALIPKEPETGSVVEPAGRKSSEWGLYFGVGLIALGIWFLLDRRFPWLPFPWHWHIWHTIRHYFWPSILIFTGLLLILRGSRSSENENPVFESKRQFSRSRTSRMIAGVCGGLAEHLQIDPSLVRIAFIAFTLLTGFWLGIAVYLVMTLVIPEESLQN